MSDDLLVTRPSATNITRKHDGGFMRLGALIFIWTIDLTRAAHARGSGNVDFEGFFGAFVVVAIGWGIYWIAKKSNGGGV